MGDGSFAAVLRALRLSRGMSLRELGRQITYDYSHLSRIESGKSVPSAGVAEKVDDLFGAEGYLTRLASAERAALELHSRNSEERDDVDRRSFLGAATGVAASAGLDGLENVRRVLADGHMRGPEEWESIVRDYGHLYHVAAPSVMLPAISADLALLGKQINVPCDANAQRQLSRTTAHLCALMAQVLANSGDLVAAPRWWRTARQTADASGSKQVQVWVRGRDAMRALYERRSLPDALRSAREAVQISLPGTVERACALAAYAEVAGRLRLQPQAVSALQQLADVQAALPRDVVREEASQFGWPESRTTFTELYVYTFLGDAKNALRVADAALAGLPPELTRRRGQVELQRATAIVQDGSVAEGLQHAFSVLETLPKEQRINVVTDLAWDTYKAVPAVDQIKPAAREFRQFLQMETTA
ncbi:hypothetical protein GCM10009789_67210 [Kribbella sancticallisti]|uniref:HTH cro/C1-type domain-containing protein n=2 Tax=Kribbella sancticallisti TaxID=460087 RepID=A0ABP4QE79_9ACTN